MRSQLFVFAILFFSVFTFGQVQIGFDIDGEAVGDESGSSVSLSSSGDVLAIGAPDNQGTGVGSGQVRVYAWDGTSWVQRGNDIDEGLVGDLYSIRVSLSSSGDILAIGAHSIMGQLNNNSYVRIYVWDGTSWVQRGNDIDGETNYDFSGPRVSLSSSGDIVAIGAPDNFGNGVGSGQVRVYTWDGTSWVQRGNDIDGEAEGEYSGSSVSLSSSGDVLAIGAPDNDGTGAGSGQVRVYTWDGTSWVQRGNDIDGEKDGDSFGSSVSLSSSGDIVAIGAPDNDGNGVGSGQVRVYAWDGTSWVQRGNDIDGENDRDFFGISVSLSSPGDVVAIGAPGNDGNGALSGHVRVYRLAGFEYFPVVQVSEDKDVCLTPRILSLFDYEYFQQGNQVGRYFIEKNKGILIPLEDSSHIRPRILTSYRSLPEYYSLDSVSVSPRIMGTMVRDTFCLIPQETVNDVRVSITPIDRARPGFESLYIMNIENIGTKGISGTLEFYYEESIIDYVSSVPMANQVIPGSVQWEYTDLLPFEKRSYEVTLKLNGPMDNPPLMGGETIVLKSKIEPISGDIDTTNNYVECYQVVVNSWDPNDKRCLSGDTLSPSNVGSELIYMIRFENEGTAEAENVIVTDYIDTLAFDINSFRLIETSHSQTTQITKGNRVDFLFDDINLPFDDANNDGYVVFGIKSKSSLLIGDTLSNRASIYFDYNLPIITNDAITLVADQPTNSKNYHKDNSVKVYPNPSNETVWISSNSAIEKIEVFDMNGRQMSSYVYLDGWQKERELNVREFMPGVYVLVIKTREGLQQMKLLVE